jgi:hypothetical protein
MRPFSCLISENTAQQISLEVTQSLQPILSREFNSDKQKYSKNILYTSLKSKFLCIFFKTL